MGQFPLVSALHFPRHEPRAMQKHLARDDRLGETRRDHAGSHHRGHWIYRLTRREALAPPWARSHCVSPRPSRNKPAIGRPARARPIAEWTAGLFFRGPTLPPGRRPLHGPNRLGRHPRGAGGHPEHHVPSRRYQQHGRLSGLWSASAYGARSSRPHPSRRKCAAASTPLPV